MPDPLPCRSCGRSPEVHRAPQSVARCANPACPEQPVVLSRDEVADVVEVWDRRCGRG